MMVNELSRRTYRCARSPSSTSDHLQYDCMYPSNLAPQGKIPGTAVLDAYNYHLGHKGEWVGILIVIIFVYRLLAWGALWIRRR